MYAFVSIYTLYMHTYVRISTKLTECMLSFLTCQQVGIHSGCDDRYSLMSDLKARGSIVLT